MVNKTPRGLLLLTYGFVIVWVILSTFPFLWTLLGSFKVTSDFFGLDWMNVVTGEFTKKQTGGALTGENYQRLWVDQEFWRNALNTLIVTVSVVVI